MVDRQFCFLPELLFFDLHLERKISSFLTPGDWDTLAAACKFTSSVAKVRGTGAFFPSVAPAASFVDRPFVGQPGLGLACCQSQFGSL